MTAESPHLGSIHDPLPDEDYYAEIVVVPVGRVDTAVEMLGLASELVHPEHGLVITLVVSLGDAEHASKVSTQLRQTIKERDGNDSGPPVEMVTEIAVSVSRGILDVARERNADVIILGVQRSAPGQVKLGTVVENVIATAPCGVLIYRGASPSAIGRVVIPVDGSLSSTIAVRLGLSLALLHDLPAKQMHVQHDYHYNPDNEDAILGYEAQMPLEQGLSKQIIAGRDPRQEIMRSLTRDDLLVIGFSQKSDFERQITDDLSDQLLNKAPGPVILISQIEWHRGWRGMIEHGFARLSPQLTLVEQNELIWNAQKNAYSTLDYTVMIVLSAALATLGLLTNSVAVIIGAMLVAPLMSPLSSFSTGMATGILKLTRRASLTLMQGVALSLLISIVMGFVLPIDTPTAEILARGSPNLLDAAIALVSGWVAAYATARKGIPAALAGVAIAAALMPPLCTVGIGIALQNINLTIGASLLFLANITFIIAAQYSTFLWLGLHPNESREGVTARQSRVWWFVLVILTIGAALIFLRLGSQAVDEAHIREQLEAEVFVDATVVEYDLVSSLPLGVQLIVQSERRITPEEVELAHLLINELYGEDVKVNVIARQIVLPTTPRSAQVASMLRAAFPNATISDVMVDESDGFLVTATLHDAGPPDPQRLGDAREEISARFEADVSIEIAFQQSITIGSAPLTLDAEA